MRFGKAEDGVNLDHCDDTVFVSGPVMTIGAKLCFSVFLVLAMVIGFFVGFIICKLPLVIIKEKDALALLLLVVFVPASLPVWWIIVVLQSFIFNFKASYNTKTGRFKLKYGLIRISKKYDRDNVIVYMVPSYSRGDWGYRAKIYSSENARLGLPFMRFGMVGGEKDAYLGASEIRNWLHQHNVSSEMKSWKKDNYEV